MFPWRQRSVTTVKRARQAGINIGGASRAAIARILSGLATRGLAADRRLLAASGLFDTAAYLTAYPDVRASGVDPLDHFILHGWREGRDPNPMFAVAWYLSKNPDVVEAGINPLLHYVLAGEREGRSASPAFSPQYYAARYPDVAAEAGGLLANYLAYGVRQGRSGAPSQEDAGEAVTDADLAILKPFANARDGSVALLVCHAADGRLKYHIRPYAERLSAAGYAVGIVACADGPFQIEPDFVDRLAAVYVRANKGLDFAAWAHVLRVEPSLFGAANLLLCNDSVLPADGLCALTSVMRKMESSIADFVGLTDSYEAEWHIQSYFMLMKQRVLGNVAFKHFIFSVRSLWIKDSVISRYELRLASTLRAAGLVCAVLYPSDDSLNPTVRHWKTLLESGFPFLKLSVLQHRQAESGVVEDADLVAAGFDLQLARSLHAQAPVDVPRSDLLSSHSPK